MNSIDRPSSRCSSRTRLSTAPWIDTSSAEVISSAMSTAGAPRAPAPARPAAADRRTAGRVGAGAGRVQVDELEQPLDLGSPVGAWPPGGIASATLSPTVIRGSSEEYGSWKTICSGRGRPRVGTGAPSRRIRPPVSGARPTAARASVDLPEPDSPTSPTTVPSGTVRLTPSTAVVAAVADGDVVEAQLAHR